MNNKRNTQANLTLLKIFTVILLCCELSSCSYEEGLSDKQVREAHLRQIDHEAQERCNEEGKFYDNLEQSGHCSDDHLLSEWACTYDNIKAIVEDQNGDLSEGAINEIRSLMDDGFTLHQCGESDLGLKVIALKQSSNDRQAATEIRRFDIPYLGLEWPEDSGVSEEAESIPEESVPELDEAYQESKGVSDVSVVNEGNEAYEPRSNEGNESFEEERESL